MGMYTSIYENMLIHKEFIEKLGYSIIERLYPASCAVYKIKNGSYKVIKISNKKDKLTYKENKWQFNHILKEHEVLKRVKGVEGIAQMLNFYKQPYKEHDEITAIIKEYIQGKELSKKISSTKNQKIIEQAVKAVHKVGFANLDLGYNNIIIEKTSEKPYLIDLGFAKSKKEVPARTFESYKKDDLQNLESLLNFK